MLDLFGDTESKKMQYRKWLETAVRLGLCIINWPDAVEALGPLFSIKKLSSGSLSSLVSGYIENSMNGDHKNKVIEIVKWSNGMINCCFNYVYNH